MTQPPYPPEPQGDPAQPQQPSQPGQVPPPHAPGQAPDAPTGQVPYAGPTGHVPYAPTGQVPYAGLTGPYAPGQVPDAPGGQALRTDRAGPVPTAGQVPYVPQNPYGAVPSPYGQPNPYAPQPPTAPSHLGVNGALQAYGAVPGGQQRPGAGAFGQSRPGTYGQQQPYPPQSKQPSWGVAQQGGGPGPGSGRRTGLIVVSPRCSPVPGHRSSRSPAATCRSCSRARPPRELAERDGHAERPADRRRRQPAWSSASSGAGTHRHHAAQLELAGPSEGPDPNVKPAGFINPPAGRACAVHEAGAELDRLHGEQAGREVRDDRGPARLRLAGRPGPHPQARQGARDRSPRLGTLFVNPGGPGEPGTTLAVDFQRTGLEQYDIVGWDPRGAGESTPVACENGAAVDQLMQLNQAPTNAAEKQALLDGWKTFGASCLAKSGALLEHIATVDTVQDLDMMRQLVGTEA